MFHIGPATATTFAALYDQVSLSVLVTTPRVTCVVLSFHMFMQYGDSYTEDVTEDTLRGIFKKVEEKVSQMFST